MKLLVSPSSIIEATYCLEADIIDVKRPAEGSLGANFPWVIREIKRIAASTPVSAAIGDYGPTPGNASLAAYGAACAGADFIKIGLMFDDEIAAKEVIEAVVRAVKEPFPEKTVVIAGYSDYERLGAISPFAISPLVEECGADISMIDTGRKDGKSTFEFMNEDVLTKFTDLNRSLGIGTALAGSLKFEDIALLKEINPEIIGVRGMVCGGDRSATVQEDLVKKAIQMVR
ncbi:MAG TPA: (5-formylfuran-3-yl)methyl phosphate synthase [Methanocorpusculum sp.]|nr:(5-formylfuran-3-yl)methyl phosphate synthase [Methanocorpusculum sp.]HJJ52949.1 (5-formylfuran-3-yl)methyl phosphate synthase [Methanocorpusculum sp.]